ncbi:hypothetical protein G7085_05620 [Tessaracoccus sp. HDW20]|uniref:hypothetical protein n=1 Tax=Tessaracoccus coleopterorum TaxID=2714950 RepID=UPI0018D46079|nr:hypothetical protein [Tessaracoccus coleopterorum]NHB84271.1 hypothetical protein [Tessaracoccus coleopterorum]
MSYRFLCASRNLTFDRCWDAVVRLDGAPTVDAAAASLNAPLTGLLRALPSMAVNPSPRASHGNHRTGRPLRADRLGTPEGVKELGFEVWASARTRSRSSRVAACSSSRPS